MDYDRRNWQYRQLMTVYHGPRFGHYLEMERQWRGRDSTYRTGLGQWTNVGIPQDVLQSSSALIIAGWEEHLVCRYGVQGELPVGLGGEPEPF